LFKIINLLKLTFSAAKAPPPRMISQELSLSPPFHAVLTVLFAMIYYLSRCDEGKMGNRNVRTAASIEKETLSRLPEEVHHIIMLPIFI
jgi:hypothetical protein